MNPSYCIHANLCGNTAFETTVDFINYSLIVCVYIYIRVDAHLFSKQLQNDFLFCFCLYCSAMSSISFKTGFSFSKQIFQQMYVKIMVQTVQPVSCTAPLAVSKKKKRANTRETSRKTGWCVCALPSTGACTFNTCCKGAKCSLLLLLLPLIRYPFLSFSEASRYSSSRRTSPKERQGKCRSVSSLFPWASVALTRPFLFHPRSFKVNGFFFFLKFHSSLTGFQRHQQKSWTLAILHQCPPPVPKKKNKQLILLPF